MTAAKTNRVLLILHLRLSNEPDHFISLLNEDLYYFLLSFMV